MYIYISGLIDSGHSDGNENEELGLKPQTREGGVGTSAQGGPTRAQVGPTRAHKGPRGQKGPRGTHRVWEHWPYNNLI